LKYNISIPSIESPPPPRLNNNTSNSDSFYASANSFYKDPAPDTFYKDAPEGFYKDSEPPTFYKDKLEGIEKRLLCRLFFIYPNPNPNP
jgi:hypothetical protein